MAYPSEIASFKFQDLFFIQSLIQPFPHLNTLFELKLLSQDSIEQDQLPKNMKNFGSNKKINFSNESVKKPTNVFRG